MNLPQTWNILRHLIDPETSKTQARVKMAKVRHACEEQDDDIFMKKLVETYIGDTEIRELPDYQEFQMRS